MIRLLVIMLLLVAIVKVAEAQTEGSLSGWYTSGLYTVCEYATEGGVYAIMINATEVCPVYITIDDSEETANTNLGEERR